MIVNYHYPRSSPLYRIDIGEPPPEVQSDDELYEWVLDQSPVQELWADEWEEVSE